MKFDGVELGTSRRTLRWPTPDLEQGPRVKKLLDDHGLGVSGIAADFGKTPPMLASLPDYLTRSCNTSRSARSSAQRRCARTRSSHPPKSRAGWI
jgi:hypothetical protein